MDYFTSYANGVLFNHGTGEIKKEGATEPVQDTDPGKDSGEVKEDEGKGTETPPSGSEKKIEPTPATESATKIV